VRLTYIRVKKCPQNISKHIGIATEITLMAWACECDTTDEQRMAYTSTGAALGGGEGGSRIQESSRSSAYTGRA